MKTLFAALQMYNSRAPQTEINTQNWNLLSFFTTQTKTKFDCILNIKLPMCSVCSGDRLSCFCIIKSHCGENATRLPNMLHIPSN